jgi:hypothetical protein
MVTVQFFGGLRDGDTMALPELQPEVRVTTPRLECRFDMPPSNGSCDYRLRMTEGQPVQLQNGNYACDVIGSVE